jgi:hypothetical protein
MKSKRISAFVSLLLGHMPWQIYLRLNVTIFAWPIGEWNVS